MRTKEKIRRLLVELVEEHCQREKDKLYARNHLVNEYVDVIDVEIKHCIDKQNLLRSLL